MFSYAYITRSNKTPENVWNDICIFSFPTRIMKKVTFEFPDYDSLWSFKEKTNAVNISIVPRRNILSGVFQQQDVELALQHFKATTIQPASNLAKQ
jgi:hypothetical protein